MRAIEAGHLRDVGDANGRVFLNDCSIGLYPQVVSRTRGRVGLARLTVLGLLGRLEQDRDFSSFPVPAVEIETRDRSLRVLAPPPEALPSPPR